MPDKILLGEIVSVHGIRGDVVIRSYTAEPEAIADYGPLTDDTGKVWRMASLRVTPKGIVARLDGIPDRTAAERLRGLKLYVPRDRLPATDDDEFYYEDLIGLTAVSPDGATLGEIVAVQNFGAGDLIEIRLAGKPRTEFVPFAAAYVGNIDLMARRAVVTLPTFAEDDGPPPPPDSDDQD
jgi:16S rRNA processing protein RimM